MEKSNNVYGNEVIRLEELLLTAKGYGKAMLEKNIKRAKFQSNKFLRNEKLQTLKSK